MGRCSRGIAMILFSASLIALPAGATGHAIDLPEGGRQGLHGMVLYGSGPFFLEHIPMLHPPHDFQIIAEVVLKSRMGTAMSGDFSKSTYTLKPLADFSLNDYAAGRLKSFDGAVFRGGFEQGGHVLPGLERVRVEVKRLKVVRQLPSNDIEGNYEISDRAHTFRSNRITPSKNFQEVENLTDKKILWCVKGPDFFEACD